MLKEVSKSFSRNKLLFLTILAGTLCWSVTMFKSGIGYWYGVGFWGPNGHDGVWHIALANSLSQGRLNMPIFAGEQIKNYHIGFDLLLAIIHKISFIPISTLYFQILPPLAAMAIGILTYTFVLEWKKSRQAALWSTFFIYFAGNFGWVLSLLKNRTLGGESTFWSQQAISTLVNPPFALSLLVMLLGLLYLGRKKYKLAAVLFGLLLPIKAYSGVLILGALFVLAFYNVIFKKKYDFLKIFIESFAISMVLFLPFNTSSTGLIEFKPFWFLETMMSFPDRIGWIRFGEAMVNYKTGGVYLKALAAYFLAFVIFILGNIGTRILLKVHFLKIKKMKWDYVDMLLWLVALGGIAAAMLFVQRGTAWNTIQFFYYSLFVASIYAGIGTADLLGMKFIKNKILAGAIIVALTAPTSIGTLMQYLPSRPPAKISSEELSALKFLKEEPNGVVLTLPFDKAAADEAVNNPPRPLYLYESTAYVAAYSEHPVWLEDQVNLDITGYKWHERRNELASVLTANNQDKLKTFLKDNNIKYVYTVKGQKYADNFGFLRKFYENPEVSLYASDY